MTADSRYDILFEPVKIGPVTAPNRFYQVPHCTGMGYNRPNSVAAMRETKAEGGWGVVCTEYCSIHPSSDDAPLPSHSLWDDKDVRSHAKMVENVHRHGALAGVRVEGPPRQHDAAPQNAEDCRPDAVREKDRHAVHDLSGPRASAPRRRRRARATQYLRRLSR